MEIILTPSQFAQVINASESTIKRWVDKGIIAANKTSGGHRRIALDDAIQFIRTKQVLVSRGDLIGMPDVNFIDPRLVEYDNADQRFFSEIMEGNTRAARAIIFQLYLKGYSVAEICDGPLQKAMSQFGLLWEQDKSGIVWEHRATLVSLQALTLLQSVFSLPNTAPFAVGGSVSGDPYMLPPLAAETVLLSEGFNAINLGPNMDLEALYEGIQYFKPSLVWLCVSYIHNKRQLRLDLEHFIERLQDQPTQIILGGRLSNQFRDLQSNAIHLGNSMAELVAFAKGLSAQDHE